ncbi:MAG TPA: ROK family protein, partial [Chloroflexota bacterium]|nr:ROK family protein [Chloroflexota bacterium]
MSSVLAIDIGGTKIAAAIVDERGGVHAEHETPTRAPSAEALFDRLVTMCDGVLAESGAEPSALSGIGVGCGGPMRYPEGEVSPLNIQVWRRFPLRDRLQRHYGRPTVVDNDAKAYALGEYWIGGGVGARGLLGIVVSTGVGGGIVLNGGLVHGAHGNAGHIGHVKVRARGPRCPCGALGCVEAIASGTSLVRLARRSAARRGESLPAELTAADLQKRAQDGDPYSLALFRDAGTALGAGIADAANLIDLDRVVIGGGVSRAADLFWPSLRETLERNARLDFTRNLDVRVSELRVS